MDSICIKDIEIFAFHGVEDHEKTNGQMFYVSAELFLSLRKAGLSDDLNDTVNYASVCDDIETMFNKTKYNLIEKCAEEAAVFLLEKHSRVERIKIAIKKPHAPLRQKVSFAGVEIDRARHTAYIALGSNMGDKEKNLLAALEAIKEKAQIEKVSSFYTTKPVGYTAQDDFLNAAAKIKTLLQPPELLAFLNGIEQKFKRERTVKWGPRTLDLDILLYDDIITDGDNLTIPHPRMHERMFVLEPLCEIAPYALHPALNKRVCELKAELEKR